MTADVLRAAAERGIPIWAEIELAFRLSPAKMIAVTGTNGKTTTTLLISEMLRHAGLDVVTAGNISADEVKKTLVESAFEAFEEQATQRTIAAEISSFQLEWVELFAPWIGLLLNVTPDHLNRHTSFQEYLDTKARLFAKQTECDWALLNFDDDAIRSHGFSDINSQRVWISTMCRPCGNSTGAYLYDGALVVELCANRPVQIMPVNDIPSTLPGKHNVYNVLAASVAALIAGVQPEVIAEAVRAFKGVPHRMELVAEKNGVRFINNSMCTNVAASIASLQAIGRPAIIIAGGADKGMDFSPLAEPFRQYASKTILIGSAADKMEAAFRKGGYIDILRAETLEDAVSMAASLASAGEAVVLSPGCASFDMFRDFEARGAAFRTAVRQLSQN
jgi:UDP-N-acetylmuramoylalanine--D-glutamate ligase